MTSSETKSILVTWPELDASVTIDLLEDKAPQICQSMWGRLPFNSIQGHALITGDMIFATTPVTCLARENVTLFTDMPLGGCLFGSSSQNLCIIYGPVTEPEGHSIWGQVRSTDLETLAKVGRAIWDNLLLPWSPVRDIPRTRKHLVVEFKAAVA